MFIRESIKQSIIPLASWWSVPSQPTLQPLGSAAAPGCTPKGLDQPRAQQDLPQARAQQDPPQPRAQQDPPAQGSAGSPPAQGPAGSPSPQVRAGC